MVSRNDYRNWDQDDEDPEAWARPGSAEAIAHNRQLRRKPSQEDRLIRQKNRRTAADDEGDQVAINKRAAIVQKIQDRNATLQEQLRLVAELEEFDRNEGLKAQAARGQVDLEDTVAERLSPVSVHEFHTASTDWLGEIDDAPSDWHQRVAAEAAVWYQSRPPFVRANAEEFSIQANAKATNVASAFGSKREPAKRTFLDYVSFLHSTKTGASGLDQIQQTVDANNSPKTTPLPPDVFDNFAPDIDPVNKGVSGTESSTRNPLIQEIMSGGSGMDGGSAEKPNEHDTSDDLSWSPPSGMQRDTAPGFSDGDPGSPEDADGHNTSFGSDSDFSKHTSMWYSGAESASSGPGADGEAEDDNVMSNSSGGSAPAMANSSGGGSAPSGGSAAGGSAGSAANSSSGATAPGAATNSASGGPSSPTDLAAQNANKIVGAGSLSPAIGYLYNLDDFRAMQAEQRSAEGKAEGRRGGRTASSTEGPNAADDVLGSESQEEADKVDPVGVKVGRNLHVSPEGGRFAVIDSDTGESEGTHHTADAANEHIDYLNNKINSGHRGMPGGIGGAGWHQTTRYASDDGFKPHSDAHYLSGDLPERPAPKHEYSHGIINGEEMTDNAHGTKSGHGHPLYSEAASGLDQIDQTIDANNHPKQTGYPTEVAFPLNDDFQGEMTTGGTRDAHAGNNDGTVKDRHSTTAASKATVELHSLYDNPDQSSSHTTHIKVNGVPLDFGHGVKNGSHVSPHVPSRNSAPAVDNGTGYHAMINDPTFSHSIHAFDAKPQGAASKVVDQWVDAHRHRQASLRREDHILNKVADMFNTNSEIPNKVLFPVANTPETTPETPSSATRGKGSSDANSPNEAPTFSDDSSHVPAGAKAYAEGYAAGEKEHGEQNVPPSLAGPGKGTTKAGSRTSAFNQNDTVNVNDGRGNLTGAQGRVVGGPHNDPYGTTYDVEHGNRSVKRYHETKLEHPNSERGKYESEQSKKTGAKTSTLITTAADRSSPDFMKGYFYASKWNMTMPIVTEGSASFEAGLYAGLTDSPSVQPHFIQASSERGVTDRLERHAAITESLSKQLSLKVGSTSLYLDTSAPNTSPSGDGTTPINGKGRPGPLDGKETGEEAAGGPSPYNGAAPFGHAVVPGAAGLETPSPTDHLMPASGYTTPRSVEKASVFRRTVQANLIREGKNR